MDMDMCGYIYKDKITEKILLKCIKCLNLFDIRDWRVFMKQFEQCNIDKDFKSNLHDEDSIALEFESPKHVIKKEGCSEREDSDHPVEEFGELELATSFNGDKETSQFMELNDNSHNETELSEDDIANSEKQEVSKRRKRNIGVCFKRKDECTKMFIENLRIHQCLWHPNHADFNHKTRRSEALKSMKECFISNLGMKLSLSEIEKGIKMLLEEYKASVDNLNDLDVKIKPITESYIEMCSFLKEVIDEIDEPSAWSESRKTQLRGVLQFGKVSESNMSFIRILQNYPTIYDPNDKNFHNQNARKAAVQKMQLDLVNETELRLSDEQLIRGSNNLKKWYNKLLDIKNRNGEKALSNDQLIYIKKCSYLPRKNLKEKVYCPDCKKVFFTDTNLKLHMFNEHKKGELPFKCESCEKSFSHKISFNTHKQRHHIGKTLKCEFCERSFAVLIDLQRHVATHTGEKPFICEQCGKSFRFKIQLGYHVTAVHSKIRAYKCTMCPKDFLKPVHLRDHIKSHLNIRDKICETCGKGFTNCHSLIRHRQIHSEVKKFVCKLCDAKFHQFVGLNSHMKRSHNVVKSKPSKKVQT